MKTEARISLNNNKPPSANLLVPLTLSVDSRFLLQLYSTLSRANVCERQTRTHQMPKITRPSIATNAILERKVRKWEISSVCDSRPQLIKISAPSQPIPCLHVQLSGSCINLCIPDVGHEFSRYAHADVKPASFPCSTIRPFECFWPLVQAFLQVYPCKTRLTKPWAGPLGIRKWAWATFGNALTLDQGAEHVR